MADINKLLGRLEGVRKAGDGKWIARCPAHDDRSPSLGIRLAGDKVLLKCFAGCSAVDVVSAVGMGLDELMPESAGFGGNGKPPRFVRADLWDLLLAESGILCVALGQALGEGLGGDDLARARQAARTINSIRREVG